MRLLQQSCRRVTLLTLCGLALGLAVAMWGTGYKIEQYLLHGRAFCVMAPAKLLTEEERPLRKGRMRAGLVVAAGQRLPLQRLPAWIAGICRCALQTWPSGGLVPAARHCKFALPEFSYFSFRPPPSRFAS